MIEQIRQKIVQGQFEFSRHAVDQSLIRHISVQELREAITAGEIIEDYPDDKYGPSCLIFGFTFVSTDIILYQKHRLKSVPVVQVKRGCQEVI
jgi:hypothetical protein